MRPRRYTRKRLEKERIYNLDEIFQGKKTVSIKNILACDKLDGDDKDMIIYSLDRPLWAKALTDELQSMWEQCHNSDNTFNPEKAERDYYPLFEKKILALIGE